MATIGKVIKELIKKRGLSQKDVAKSIGKSTTALSQIINGVYKPQSDTLEEISKVLNIPVPVIHFLCIDEKDIPDNKKEIFIYLKPLMEKLLFDIFELSEIPKI